MADTRTSSRKTVQGHVVIVRTNSHEVSIGFLNNPNEIWTLERFKYTFTYNDITLSILSNV